MLRLTLAQMRRSIGRLAAAGIAIAIGTAFVAATLIAGAVITRTSYDALAASYADSDLVVTGRDTLTPDVLDAVRDTDGVAAAQGQLSFYVELGNGSRTVVTPVTAVAADPRLDAQTVTDGRPPERTGEIALPGPLAERLEVTVGDTLTAYRGEWVTATPADAGEEPSGDVAAGDAATEESSARWVERPEELAVVGLSSDPAGAFAQSGGAAVLSDAELAQWAQDDMIDGEVLYDAVVVVLAEGADVEATRSALAGVAPDSTVRTKDEQAQAMAASLTDGSNVLTTVVLGFAAVALLVAALVIANTFQVLIAQRTRTLALLRCVGANAAQLRRSVLLEATLLGLASSLAGLLLGTGVGQVALTVLGRMELDVPLPAVVSLTPAVVLVPLVVGTLVTLLASFAPARAATRVAPLAALRPADAPTVTHRRNRPRLVLSTLATLGGFGLLAAAVVLGRVTDPLIALALGVLGGAMSFVGVVVGSVFWLPRVVALTGRAFGRTGPAARLAAANTVRNPRRTAATSTALLIGVTLVTMMSTGAASARVTLNDELNAEFPVDVMVGGLSDRTDAGTPPVTESVLRTVTGVDGVETGSLVEEAVLLVGPEGGAQDATTLGARILEPTQVDTLSRTPQMAAGLADSTVVMAPWAAETAGVVDGDTVTLVATRTDPDTGLESTVGTGVQRTVVVTTLSGGLIVTPATADAVGATERSVTAWARLADSADPATVVPAIQDALVDSPVMVTGAAVERAMYATIIDTLLAVVVGLLAVAVVIALIGVANTLSLSVLERRRESATLRVIGLSKRQLRGTLALEGTLIAGVGAVLGIVLGVAYGWAGAVTVLGVIGDVRLDVPWGQLLLVLGVSVAAGLIASVLPGRSAARTSPWRHSPSTERVATERPTGGPVERGAIPTPRAHRRVRATTAASVGPCGSPSPVTPACPMSTSRCPTTSRSRLCARTSHRRPGGASSPRSPDGRPCRSPSTTSCWATTSSRGSPRSSRGACCGSVPVRATRTVRRCAPGGTSRSSRARTPVRSSPSTVRSSSAGPVRSLAGAEVPPGSRWPTRPCPPSRSGWTSRGARWSPSSGRATAPCWCAVVGPGCCGIDGR
ncbi:FtsX-like permease family protein [Cellulomonas sp. ATA003]|uniref:ABC transporter permease n=1 Tax=Cellulomonas sp. ATA003 TaxID=3073064 RepID=UPI002872FDD3|nr:FtsX-like permease family protein [Cellulomonas sp. ATA003]WNB86294.1 FtsX-like permease family protein [Cellulomonas sp. ATA003]